MKTCKIIEKSVSVLPASLESSMLVPHATYCFSSKAKQTMENVIAKVSSYNRLVVSKATFRTPSSIWIIIKVSASYINYNCGQRYGN